MSHDGLEVSTTTIPGARTVGEETFPSVFVCQSTPATMAETTAWLSRCRAELVLRASRAGALLFRGFPVRTAEDFDRFIAAFELPNFAYGESLSNAVRIVKTARVFTANEAPPDITIFLHHEMAQTPIYPSRLFFFCEQPADSGGATPLCRSDLLWERIVATLPEFARDCESKGLRYSNVMPTENDPTSGMGRGWQSTLRATTKAEAEARLRSLGYAWEWLHDDCLRATTPILPAVRDLGDGRKSFFNQLIAAFQGWKDARNDPSKALFFGDGSPLDRHAIERVTELAESLCFDVPWQKGDVALVDNYVVMHGRRTFTGVRKVLASLVAA